MEIESWNVEAPDSFAQRDFSEPIDELFEEDFNPRGNHKDAWEQLFNTVVESTTPFPLEWKYIDYDVVPKNWQAGADVVHNLGAIKVKHALCAWGTDYAQCPGFENTLEDLDNQGAQGQQATWHHQFPGCAQIFITIGTAVHGRGTRKAKNKRRNWDKRRSWDEPPAVAGDSKWTRPAVLTGANKVYVDSLPQRNQRDRSEAASSSACPPPALPTESPAYLREEVTKDAFKISRQDTSWLTNQKKRLCVQREGPSGQWKR
jgi:hypothetical protein